MVHCRAAMKSFVKLWHCGVFMILIIAFSRTAAAEQQQAVLLNEEKGADVQVKGKAYLRSDLDHALNAHQDLESGQFLEVQSINDHPRRATKVESSNKMQVIASAEDYDTADESYTRQGGHGKEYAAEYFYDSDSKGKGEKGGYTSSKGKGKGNSADPCAPSKGKGTGEKSKGKGDKRSKGDKSSKGKGNGYDNNVDEFEGYARFLSTAVMAKPRMHESVSAEVQDDGRRLHEDDYDYKNTDKMGKGKAKGKGDNYEDEDCEEIPEAPSTSPSKSPSKLPSTFPSKLPSTSPSKLPSKSPSTSPSTFPSDPPSEVSTLAQCGQRPGYPLFDPNKSAGYSGKVNMFCNDKGVKDNPATFGKELGKSGCAKSATDPPDEDGFSVLCCSCCCNVKAKDGECVATANCF